ncbi:MAG TPA: ester cyclase [Thermomicrobiaceae bacterium]|nr:ester cyclase [Thermomicrobiaceae bacterium]
MAYTPEENNQIAKDFFETAWNYGDFSVLDKYLTPDSMDYSTLHGHPEQGSDSFRQIISMFRAGFPDIHLTIEDEIYTGDKVVHRWVLSGTHSEPFMGMPATGKQVAFNGMTIVEMHDGKIAGRWSIPDMMGLMTQLGAVPPPPA